MGQESIARPLMMAAGAVIVAGGTAVGVYVAGPGGGEEEIAQRIPTASATSTSEPVTPEPSPSGEPSPTPVTLPISPTPSVWAVYADEDGRFAVKYPSGWFRADGSGSVYSFDPATTTGYGPLPVEVMKVDVGSNAAGAGGCGPHSINQSTGEVIPTAGATQVSLGGFPAWQIVRVAGDPAIEGTLTRIQGVSALYQGYCFKLVAYFTQKEPDIETFEEILRSYEFKF